jgi:hypothetical protein
LKFLRFYSVIISEFIPSFEQKISYGNLMRVGGEFENEVSSFTEMFTCGLALAAVLQLGNHDNLNV